ncbi:MAG: cyclic-di-AMP receptor [Sporolactobacillus sp.]
MKLVLAVVQDKDSNNLQDALVDANFQATKLASTGGFLRSGNTTFLIGVSDHQIDYLLGIIRDQCKNRKQVMSPMTSLDGSTEGYMFHPIEIEVGGAAVFVLDVNRFEHF